MGHTSPTHFTFELEEAWARPSGRRSAVSILSWVSVAGYLVLGIWYWAALPWPLIAHF